MSILTITAREFREHQKDYFEKVDKGIQLIVRRKNKAYSLMPITDDDLYFSPQLMERIRHSIAQVEEGKITRIDNVKDFLGSL